MLRTRRVVESGCEEWAKTFIKDQAPEYYDGADDAWACDDDGGSLGARSVAFSLVLRLASSDLGQRVVWRRTLFPSPPMSFFHTSTSHCLLHHSYRHVALEKHDIRRQRPSEATVMQVRFYSLLAASPAYPLLPPAFHQSARSMEAGRCLS